MAWRAGCQVADMEFVQFHPTALQVDGRAAGLVTERLRGEGAVLRLPGGERFMPAHDRARNWRRATSWRARSGPRCRVSICPMCTWTSRTGRAPGWTGTFRRDGAVRRAWHRYRHAAHAGRALRYACGGVRADVDGATGIAGLRAVGEVARTGLHGANRLASNSLLECVVMGRRQAPSPHRAMQ